MKTIRLLWVFLAFGGSKAQSLPVVPGAFGFGMDTRAAYACGTNPAILRVTSLDDSGAGSLREALTASGPRVVVFEISGYIHLVTPIFVEEPCVTVAGQTAPSPGITVRGGSSDATIEIHTHDVLFQHLRIRPGDSTCNSGIGTWTGYSPPYPVPHNVVFDHLSVSWGVDENIYVGGYTDVNVTVWRSITSEGLWQAPVGLGCGGPAGEYGNGHGLLVYVNTRSVSVLQNLFAHNVERNPYAVEGSHTYTANNFIYNAHEGPLFAQGLWGLPTPSPVQSTLVGNYIKRGITPSPVYAPFAVGVTGLTTGAQLFASDNDIDQGTVQLPIIPFVIIRNEGVDPRVSSPPVILPGYTPMPSSEVPDFVLANAGARPADRDAVDIRVVNDARNRTGGFITSPNDVGGYPALAEIRRALTPPSNPHSVSATGYTNLEDWLHGYAEEVEHGTRPPRTPAPPTGLRIVGG